MRKNSTDKTLEDIMIPKSNIFAIKAKEDLRHVANIIAQHKHTRVPVYENNLDNIVGYIHIKDVLDSVLAKNCVNISAIIRKHITSAYSMKPIDLLVEMRKKRIHIAIVLDEYGCTIGLVTIEDVIETILGRIDDEYDDVTTKKYNFIRPGVIISNARVGIRELENATGLDLSNPDDDFDTIGGLITSKIGHVPQKGELIKINDRISVKILESSPRSIKKIKMTFDNK